MPVSDQGNLTGRYTLVPRTLIFLICGEKVLLLKGASDKRLWANRFNGIGGHVECDEDVLGAALRELHEETGLILPTLQLCGVVTIDTGKEIGVGLYVFRGECDEEAAETIYAGASTNEGQLEWIAWKDLERYPLVEDLPVLIQRLFSMQPQDPPFSAHTWYDASGRMQMDFFE